MVPFSMRDEDKPSNESILKIDLEKRESNGQYKEVERDDGEGFRKDSDNKTESKTKFI